MSCDETGVKPGMVWVFSHSLICFLAFSVKKVSSTSQTGRRLHNAAEYFKVVGPTSPSRSQTYHRSTTALPLQPRGGARVLYQRDISKSVFPQFCRLLMPHKR